MYGSGAGTGMEATQAERRPIPWARPRGLTAWDAAGAGAFQPSTCVPRAGAASARTAGTSLLAFGLSAPSLGAQVARRNARARANGVSERLGMERRVAG